MAKKEAAQAVKDAAARKEAEKREEEAWKVSKSILGTCALLLSIFLHLIIVAVDVCC